MKEVQTLEKAARLADDYTLTHKACFVSKAYPRGLTSLKVTPQSYFKDQNPV